MGLLQRLRTVLARDHAIHLAGAQLALVALMSAGLALAAAPSHPTARLMSTRLSSVTPVAQEQPEAQGAGDDLIRLQDLGADEARRWNASNPIATGPNPAAKPFRLNAEGVLDEARATDCMTAAIYYEAGFEGAEGQRAVAQVVLNRMRHPAFPKTICGVVFQGSERKTGCQFTFTCDGALGRRPDDAAWGRARKVAEAALNGFVMKKVGNATHYHADYVAPYWSPTLVKVAVVGQHIFYRWTGGAGLPPAFGGRYGGGEMAGLRVATLDNLGKASPKLILAANSAEAASIAAPPVEPPAAKAGEPEKAPELVTPPTVAEDAAAIVKPEDLDWQGRPKAKAPPRLAMPSHF